MISGISQNFQANIAKNQRTQAHAQAAPRANTLQADSVNFGKKIPTPNAKMRNYAQMYLKEIGLKKGQALHVTAESRHVPFIRVLEEEAYKMGSGNVVRKTIEPEFEALKKKHGIIDDFAYKALQIKELEDKGALFVAFDDKNCPYKKSGLTKGEARKLEASITDKYPKEVEDVYQIDPKEILKSALDVHQGEPVSLNGQREHLPRLLKLADWLYSENGTKLINLNLTEKKEYDAEIPFFEHASADLIGKVRPSQKAALKEMCDKDIARLILRGNDPTQFAEMSKEAKVRMNTDNAAYRKATEAEGEELCSNHPWACFWMPSTRAIKKAYPEYGDHQRNEAMTHSLRDANIINRTGQLAPHIERLEYITTKMNELLQKGFRSMQVLSFDPKTWRPDGKSNLIVGLSDLSVFKSARMNMKKTGHNVLVNIPTEESFTAPKAFATAEEILTGKRSNVTRGHVTSTKPFVINGTVIEDMRLEVEDAKIVEATSRTNQDYLRDFLKQNENADRFGEFAIVEDSPLAKLNRVFYNTLLDENTACHIAIGDAYPNTVRGAEDFEDFDEMQKYLKDNGINHSTTHNDFMVGGPNVTIFGINETTGEKIVVLEKNKFQL